LKLSPVLLVLVFTLTSNSYGGSNGANDLNAFVKACSSAYNFGTPMCECLSKKADKKFTPNGFAFLVATMNKNHEKAKRIGSKLDMAESLEVGMFFVNTPQKCAEEINPN
jgi:hypothetical protein